MYTKSEGKQPFICGDACLMPEKHELLNTLRTLLRALPLLAVLGLPCAVLAEETGGASASTTSLLPENLFSGESLFGRLSDRVRFSGFARLVGGYLDVEDVHYQGYNDAISFGQHSLFALQTDVELTETFSFTTQLLAHTSAARDSGLEWAYLTWRPSDSWRFKAGKLRTPLYLHSDTIDVGFSYPWILPPQAVYTPYSSNDITGLSAAYQFNIREWSIQTKAYWGRFEGAITVLDEDPVGIKVDKARGLILALNRDNLRLRASYHRFAAEVKMPQLARLARQLRQLGYRKSADSLNTKTDIDFMQAGVSYDTLDYFLKAEWTRVSSSPAFAVISYDSYYLSGGYTFYPFNLPITPHVTFANISVDDARPPVDEIRGNLPELALLRLGYQRAFQSDLIGNDSLQRLSIGLRWDVNPAVALKAEWIHLRTDRDKRGFFTFDRAADFDRKANLFLLGLEWVF